MSKNIEDIEECYNCREEWNEWDLFPCYNCEKKFCQTCLETQTVFMVVQMKEKIVVIVAPMKILDIVLKKIAIVLIKFRQILIKNYTRKIIKNSAVKN